MQSKKMRKHIVSIVGRPNVGKSTLFNRLCRKRSAIVDFEAGITRDRKYEEVEEGGKVFILVDTGGIVCDSNEAMDKIIRDQALLAIQESDLILFWWMLRRVPQTWIWRSPRFFIRTGIR